MMQILSHTPTFVFILFFVLLVFGFTQTRDRKVNLILAFLLPVLMAVFSLAGVFSSFGISLITIGLWLSGLIIVAYLVHRFFSTKGISYFSAEGKFFIPGSWVPFSVIMAIFFTKYAVGIMTGMQMVLVHQPHFIFILSFLYGCFSGYFIARGINLMVVQSESER